MSWVVPWQLGTTGTSILSTTTNIPCSPNGLRCTKYNFDILWQSWTFVYLDRALHDGGGTLTAARTRGRTQSD